MVTLAREFDSCGECRLEIGGPLKYRTLTDDEIRAVVVALDPKVRGATIEWQPIETAPRNGTTILLRGKQTVADGWFGGLTGAGWVWPYIYAEPLYWMPLPEAPNVELSGSSKECSPPSFEDEEESYYGLFGRGT